MNLLAIATIIILSSEAAFAGTLTPEQVIDTQSFSEWAIIGAVVVLGLIGVFILIKRRKRGCCN